MSITGSDSDDPLFKEEEEEEEEDEDEDRPNKSGAGAGAGSSQQLNLTGFLFGNIDTEGRTDSDYLDRDSASKLSGLAKMLDSGGGGGMPADLFTEDAADKVRSLPRHCQVVIAKLSLPIPTLLTVFFSSPGGFQIRRRRRRLRFQC